MGWYATQLSTTCLTSLVLFRILVEFNQFIRDRGKGTPQSSHHALGNGNLRGEHTSIMLLLYNAIRTTV